MGIRRFCGYEAPLLRVPSTELERCNKDATI
jgi:hypothetical protein